MYGMIFSVLARRAGVIRDPTAYVLDCLPGRPKCPAWYPFGGCRGCVPSFGG